jgi:hypothetical protein
MIASELKPMEDILSSLEGQSRVFVVACDGCSAGCEVSGPEQVAEMIEALKKAGKQVTGSARVDFACNAGLVALTLTQRLREVAAAESLLVISCGVGIQTVADAVEMQVHPATNSTYLGGFQGLWRSSQRCHECGECLLDYTGGICPLTACSKSLIYGTCGGPNNGKCEVDSSIECGWDRIYQRLKAIGRLDLYAKMPPLRNFQKMVPTGKRRASSLWALENLDLDEEEAPAAVRAD